MPTGESTGAVNVQVPRVIKCPTPQCPGWITLDNTRHQTEPCRYCRVGADTLRFLLSRVGAEHKALPPEVHDVFNRLMLTMAGMWGRNVYLRPSEETLVDLVPGARGVTIEYNPALGAAGSDGAAPLVGTILHKLLHFEAHLNQRPPQLAAKSGAKEKESLGPLLMYVFTLADHAWVVVRLKDLYPSLYGAQSRWGLDLAQMLVGSESMFNRYLSERNLKKLLPVLQDVGDDSGAFRSAVMQRLAGLTSQIVEREREETRKLFLAEQLANTRLLNPDAYRGYQDALSAMGVADLAEAIPLAERLYSELEPLSGGPPPAGGQGETQNALTIDPGAYHHALQGAIKALGMANYFEIKS